MFLDQVVGPLEARDYMLQCLMASRTIRLARIETCYRPRGGIGTIADRDHNDAQGLLAIREGLELGHNQSLKFLLRLCRFLRAD